MSSYLTQEEIDALQTSELSRKAPFLIRGVSQGYFSVARLYGGMKYNGASYDYLPETDECIREDVRKFIHESRKTAKASP